MVEVQHCISYHLTVFFKTLHFVVESKFYKYDKPQYIPLNIIAQQIIQNAQNGHQSSIDFLKDVADDVAKQSVSNGDDAKPDVKPINPPKDESNEPKTCQQAYSGMPQCQYLNGFKYSTRRQALIHLIGLRKEKPENYNKFCGTYGTHEKFYPNKNISTPRGNYGASLLSCKCCQDSSKGAMIQTKWRID